MKRFETKLAKQRRIRKQKISNLLAMFAALIIALVLFVVIMHSRNALLSKNAEYASREAELSQQLQSQEERSLSLEEYRKYVQTKKYVEEIAKNKFGMLYPDEKVFRPNESGN